MKTHYLILLSFFFVTINIYTACSKGTTIPDPKIELKYQSDNTISDLVLIYDGGLHRKPWTTDMIRPYVYRENAGENRILI